MLMPIFHEAVSAVTVFSGKYLFYLHFNMRNSRAVFSRTFADMLCICNACRLILVEAAENIHENIHVLNGDGESGQIIHLGLRDLDACSQPLRYIELVNRGFAYHGF